MGYHASGSGYAVMDQRIHIDDVIKMLNREKENDIFDSDVTYYQETDENGNTGLGFSYSDTHYDEDKIMPFLKLLSPLITEGEMYMDGEDTDHWRWVFDPEEKWWNEDDGEVVYGGLESYDDNDLIKELKRRGYSVRKVSKKRA